ncbi:3-oxoacyl-[acyl-carrier-protein] synthase III C-terminal domain-containing protein [Amycolatopsis nigrescens]|uniref:3-oxoacyl-[acyl-carrier-protein] synthase III C-terminal domain-containing protein n=1 Tax=Amycolatopsis nigrescens TaxID=381445 RepID=UPI00035F3F34|nr:3-oxoacyl-[acyl-carrier-protein] synthase III C-terminal domain-containing protein [Amycolatopsis nigrescens]
MSNTAAPKTVNPVLNAIAAELPRPAWSTEELLTAGHGHLSDKLVHMFGGLGVQTRHSVLANYPDVLFQGAEPKLDVSATELAVAAARKCLAKAEVPMHEIGLVLGVTSSPGRLLPSLVCDMFAQMPEIPRDTANLSIEYMGCSAMAKVVDTVRWFLTSRPDQRVLVCFMEAITPLSPDLPAFYSHFSEIRAEDRQETVDAMHGFLFGDAAVAMVFGADGPGPSFGPAANLTNERAEDTELGTVPDGGSDLPLVQGRRLYTLSPDVTPRGVFYASETVRTLLAGEDCELADPGDASMLLMHTGSTRILDGLCQRFGVSPDSETVASSYRVLRDYGNTIGCSVPLMLAEPVHREAGHGLLVAFGLSFSCGAFAMTVPPGGWTP